MRKGIYATYRAEREKGLTYQQIADKYGVSRQTVGQACGKANPKRFQFHGEDKVIYPNLRNWMNDNKVSSLEMLRRMGFEAAPATYTKLRGILRGKFNPRKNWIDGLLSVTEMTYEELFEVSK